MDEGWNKELLPHLGRHPNDYHNFVLEEMIKAAKNADGSVSESLKLFNSNIKQLVIATTGLLRAGWK